MALVDKDSYIGSAFNYILTDTKSHLSREPSRGNRYSVINEQFTELCLAHHCEDWLSGRIPVNVRQYEFFKRTLPETMFFV